MYCRTYAIVIVFAAAIFAWMDGRVRADDEPTPEQLEFFENKIRPVLVEHCYECHSKAAEESGKLRGGLLLDSREAIRYGGDTGPAVVPTQLDESLILSALRHEDYEMPPDGKLSDQIIADFSRWIEMGAPDPRDGVVTAPTTIDIDSGREFWSLKRFEAVKIPETLSQWALTDIDRFVERLLVENGLAGNKTASPRILIRRAYFDLTGLPPTREELETWLSRLSDGASDSEPVNISAYEELLDELLASPRYGERWARHWMDVVRFAESHGYEQDYDRPNAYHYRDFLIRAINEDLPYDEFVRWQIAGDELAPDNPQALMATGFLGAGSFPTQLTEAEFESARYDELDDMVSTMGVAFLGLSIGCARCHDHKFDPIPTRDYYRIAANFTSTIRTELDMDLNPEKRDQLILDYEAKLAELTESLRTFEQESLTRDLTRWLNSNDFQLPAASTWSILDGAISSTGGTKFERLEDGSLLATGETPNGEVYEFETELTADSPVALRLETLTHPSLPGNGPGRAPNGNFALGNISVWKLSSESQEQIELVKPEATHQQNAGALSIAASIDDDDVSGWAVDGQIGKDQAAVFRFAEGSRLAAGDKIRIQLRFHHPNTKHAAGRIRLSMSVESDPMVVVGAVGPGMEVVEAIERLRQMAKPSSAREEFQLALNWYKPRSAEWRERQEAVDAHRSAGPAIERAKVMICSEGLPHMSHHADGRGYPHFYNQTFQLRRGDVAQKIEPAQEGFLSVLTPVGMTESDWSVDGQQQNRTSYRRAALANWLTDVDRGAGSLAARVIVNRLWQHHFGRGIVATSNDFGNAGERPSHPELLDYLALQLIDSGWSLKSMHKDIMLSRVYMQSPDYVEEMAAIDIENRFLWRREPRRLEAEAIRDSMVFVSGELDERMYGPGTLDANMRRRSVYFFIKRSRLIPMMMLFDWPEHLVSIGNRSTTTIAPQALMLMNDPFCHSLAKSFFSSLTHDDPHERVVEVYLRCFGRRPSEEEVRLSLAFVERQRDLYSGEASESDADAKAWTDLCQAMFSTSEFLYID